MKEAQIKYIDIRALCWLLQEHNVPSALLTCGDNIGIGPSVVGRSVIVLNDNALGACIKQTTVKSMLRN